MRVTSTLNPENKSESVPVALYRYGNKRKFALKSKKYEATIELVKQAFGINPQMAIVLETSALNVCQGQAVEIEERAFSYLYDALDEINVRVLEDEEPAPPSTEMPTANATARVQTPTQRKGKAKANASASASTASQVGRSARTKTVPSLSARTLQNWHDDGGDDDEAEEVSSVVDYEMENEAEGSDADMRGLEEEEEDQHQQEEEGDEEEQAPAVRSSQPHPPPTPLQFEEEEEGEEDGGQMLAGDDVFNPSARDGGRSSAADGKGPSRAEQSYVEHAPGTPAKQLSLALLFPESPIARKSGASSRTTTNHTTSHTASVAASDQTVKQEKHEKEPAKAKFKPKQQQQQQAPKDEPMASTAARGTPAAAPAPVLAPAPARAPKPAAPEDADKRIAIIIQGPSEEHSAQFKMRGRHPIHKILKSACMNYGLDYPKSKLYLAQDAVDDAGNVIETEFFHCPREKTASQCGVVDGSRLVIEVTEEEED